MSETKACTITENELEILISNAAHQLSYKLESNERDSLIERLNYLNKRLKAFKEDQPIDKGEPVKSSNSSIETKEPTVTW